MITYAHRDEKMSFSLPFEIQKETIPFIHLFVKTRKREKNFLNVFCLHFQFSRMKDKYTLK